MSAVVSQTADPRASGETENRPQGAFRRAQAALYVGAVTTVPFTAIWIFAELTPDGDKFRHAADYWYTGLGIPYMAAPLVLLPALRSLQQGRDGRVGRLGLLVISAGLVVFLAMLPYGLAAGRASSFGPTYVLATLATFVGLALFCLGSFRAGLLPRWIFPLWFVAWILGGPLGLKGMGLLLGAVYLTMAALLPKRANGTDARR